MHMDSYCIILLRSYNYDTSYNDSNEEDNVNNLILPIEFNNFIHWIQQKPVCKIYMHFNQISHISTTRFQQNDVENVEIWLKYVYILQTVFSWIQPVKSC